MGDGQAIVFGDPNSMPDLRLQEIYRGEGTDLFDIATGKETRSAGSMYYLRKVQEVEDRVHELQQLIEGLEINLGGQGIGAPSTMVDEEDAGRIRLKMEKFLSELPEIQRELNHLKQLYKSESGEPYKGYGGGKRRKSRRNKRRGSKRRGSKRRGSKRKSKTRGR